VEPRGQRGDEGAGKLTSTAVARWRASLIAGYEGEELR
jgi:hypothetical protein